MAFSAARSLAVCVWGNAGSLEKFLTLFNIVAGSASIAGLYVTVQANWRSDVLYGIFVATLVLCVYVLLVPGTALERNVASKLHPSIARYENRTGGTEEIQRGEFQMNGFGPVTLEFHRPFEQPPGVEVLDVASYGRKPILKGVTSHQVVFDYTDSAPAERRTFVWLARGVPLR